MEKYEKLPKNFFCFLTNYEKNVRKVFGLFIFKNSCSMLLLPTAFLSCVGSSLFAAKQCVCMGEQLSLSMKEYCMCRCVCFMECCVIVCGFVLRVG